MITSMLRLSDSIFKKIPESLILFIARFSIAAVFWKSGQTKIEGFSLDLIGMEAKLGWPQLKESTLFLFEYEYNLSVISAGLAALLATVAEHLLPILILTGFFTRFAAFGLASMTLVIQFLVYPDAYPTHGTWLAIALLLMYRGAGLFSLDHLLLSKTIKAE
ncbi:DoxX family protein [Marinomonas algarum]|uniref:DoxX family protein n=1 Tax=Marinomonas algarum TaxID=2883105 RepID=A0A9X1IMD2_9GAMM|nr:DoxX family protein [Marinomonas algarum]MCB5162129.1 DoxX family protein [Marinomonas algarum]